MERLARTMVLVIIAWLTLSASGVFAQDHTGTGSASPSRSERVASLLREYDKARMRFFEAQARARTVAEIREAHRLHPPTHEYATRLWGIVQEEASDDAAGVALVWIMQYAVSDAGLRRAALDLLTRHHKKRRDLTTVCQALSFARMPWSLDFLTATAKTSPHIEVRGAAWYGIGMVQMQLADLSRKLAVGSDKLGPVLANTLKQLKPSEIAALENQSPAQRDAMAIDAFNHALSKLSDVKLGKGKSLVDAAREQILRLRNLAIGRHAPDIVGKDADGKQFRLSDYRGRVVMLSFWGDW